MGVHEMKSRTALILSILAWALLVLYLLTAPAASAEAPTDTDTAPPVVTVLDIGRLPGDDIPATEYAYYNGPLVYYPITNDDRSTLEHIVQGEAGGEPYEGKLWVATCLLNAMRLEDMTAEEVRTAYQYAGWSETVSDETVKAVSAVFDDGETTHDTVLWFYAPKLCNGTWHETQSYVATVGGHKFFAPKEGTK